MRLLDSMTFQIFLMKSMPFSESTYVVIATHDHGLDQMVIEGILAHSFKYGALIGSKRKALMTKKRLLAKGFSNELIKKLSALLVLISMPKRQKKLPSQSLHK